jgi:predicted DNA binding CopG/RHH family protein
MKKKTHRKTREIKYDPKEWDESKSVAVEPEKRIGSEVSTSIRLPKHMVSKLRKVAMRKGGIGYQTLIKIWIAERLEEESAA